MSYGQRLPKANKQSATALTNYTLVAAQPGYIIEVASIFVMVDVAMTVTFKSSTTTKIFEAYPSANGGLVIPTGSETIFQTAAGEALTLSTSVDGNVFVTVNYLYGET